jgi:hypothetical protein
MTLLLFMEIPKTRLSWRSCLTGSNPVGWILDRNEGVHGPSESTLVQSKTGIRGSSVWRLIRNLGGVEGVCCASQVHRWLSPKSEGDEANCVTIFFAARSLSFQVWFKGWTSLPCAYAQVACDGNERVPHVRRHGFRC